jgi:hypothetical protein
MSDETNQPKDYRKELTYDEFFLNTFVKLQITLSSLERDSVEKSELLHSITDNLTAIAYNIKDVKDRDSDVQDLLKEILTRLEGLNNRLMLVEAKMESNTVSGDADIKEIKYAVQNLNSALIVLKTEKKVREKESKEENSENSPKKKLDVLELLKNVWEAIKNLRLIAIITFIIIMVVAALLGYSDVWTILPKLIGKLLGIS